MSSTCDPLGTVLSIFYALPHLLFILLSLSVTRKLRPGGVKHLDQEMVEPESEQRAWPLTPLSLLHPFHRDRHDRPKFCSFALQGRRHPAQIMKCGLGLGQAPQIPGAPSTSGPLGSQRLWAW